MSIQLMIESVSSEILEDGRIRVAPEDTAQFKALFREAAEKRLKLSLRGQCTQGASPSGHIEVSTLKLDKVWDLQKEDLTLTADAGIPYHRVRETLKEFGCELVEYTGTLGGCLCGRRDTIAHRALSSRFMGVTYVLPTGEELDLGSRSVKDVAGYNIAPLLLGSKGRLGLAARFTLNLAPLHREIEPPRGEGGEGLSAVCESPATLVSGLVEAIDPFGIFG